MYTNLGGNSLFPYRSIEENCESLVIISSENKLIARDWPIVSLLHPAFPFYSSLNTLSISYYTPHSGHWHQHTEYIVTLWFVHSRLLIDDMVHASKFSYLIGVLPRVQEYFSQLYSGPEMKSAWTGLESTATTLVKETWLIVLRLRANRLSHGAHLNITFVVERLRSSCTWCLYLKEKMSSS